MSGTASFVSHFKALFRALHPKWYNYLSEVKTPEFGALLGKIRGYCSPFAPLSYNIEKTE